MTQFEIWKIAIDIGLALSLLAFAFRFFRSAISPGHIRQVASLDASLKGLIRDAEIAGNALNDQLRARENSLKGLLGDFEAAQSRAGRMKSEIEQERLTIDSMLKRIRSEAVEMERTRDTRPAAPIELTRPVENEAPARTLVQPAHVAPPEPSPVRSESAPVPLARHEPAPPAESPAVPTWNESTAWGRVNIYGDPIGNEPAGRTPTLNPEFRQHAKPLRDSIEKEVTAAPIRSASTARQALNEIIRAAESMLRTGRSLEAVSSATRLPLDEVRRISQRMIREETVGTAVETANEQPATHAPADDPRLGVLSGMKRQLQTV